ncbi:MAG: Gfo/Idh/MocA family oxidoreductase, partial [Bacteroidetes bacterium]|nr:Gfo/Idh/MocA family oxidoreductase [Bacteroidota bacterium]
MKRRNFLKNMAGGAAAVGLGGVASSFVTAGAGTAGQTANSYRRIIGANDTIRMAVIGSNGRGSGMAAVFARQPQTEVVYVCDVEEKARQKGINAVVHAGKPAPRGENDFRKMLTDKDVDAVYIATPDHWHSPATILACAAGKHAYCEKPLSHNPHEGELAIAAAAKYNRVVQLGTQRRSWKLLTEGIGQLHAGAIGKI